MNLNIYQRIVLIIGGVLFVISIITAPSIIYIKDYGYAPYPYHPEYKNKYGIPQKDKNSIMVRGLIVWGITIPVFFALSSTKKENKENKDK
ncbi:MAG: hypothetical protein PWP57_661 [Candidatus Atribacteria bacterium]|nr:hypothetical protein [Candidatus Atribacteria bacterium]